MRRTSSEHRVQQENPSVLDVFRQLLVEETRLACLFVSLNQNLADANASAAVTEALFHGLAGAHDADTADLSLELDTIVMTADGGGDFLLDDRQVVQAFFDEQTNDTIRVEDKVGAVGAVVADHTARGVGGSDSDCFHQGTHLRQQSDELRCLR